MAAYKQAKSKMPFPKASDLLSDLPSIPPEPSASPPDPASERGCMIFLGFLLIVFPPLLFLAAPVALIFIVAGFFAWFAQMATQKLFGIRPLSLFLVYWATLSLCLIAGLVWVKHTADNSNEIIMDR